MPERSSVSGTVTAIFGHRFVIENADGKHLADIGPEATRQIRLHEGDAVRVTGERRSSEIKVTEIVRAGGKPIRIAHQMRAEAGASRDPRAVIEAITRHGFDVVTEHRPTPRHGEIRKLPAKLSSVKPAATIRKPSGLLRPKSRPAPAAR